MRRLAFAALLAVLATPSFADSPPVDIRFVIEAKEFIDGLGTAREGVEREVTGTLLEACRNPKAFRFLGWMNGNAAAPNRLVVALVQQRKGAGFDSVIEYRGTIANGALPPALQEVAYRWLEAKNADDAASVKARLNETIVRQFSSEPFRQGLLEYFVSQVPLADSVSFSRQHVIVPVPATILQADETKSSLRVQFKAKSDGFPGTMTLHELVDYPEEAGVLCTLAEFNFGDLITTAWTDRIPQVFGPTKVRDVRVTMLNYAPKPFPDTQQGKQRND
jgi:hypothetical protein